MPYSNGQALKLFFSYASEDQQIADALSTTLRTAFATGIEVTMMSEFPPGINYRDFINDSISQTDVLIAIATGRLKPSHSFTGSEVGSFSFSMRSSPKISGTNQERRMIPFAILARVPDTINEFEGINIDPNSLQALRFDPDAPTPADTTANLTLFNFLTNLEQLISAKTQAASQSGTQIAERLGFLRKLGAALQEKLIALMLVRERSIDFPKAKLIVRLRGQQMHDPETILDNATIRIEGKCYDAFGLAEGDDIAFAWPTFSAKAAGEIVHSWKKNLSSVVSASIDSKFLDDSSIISFDRKKVFRIFASKRTEFYNDDVETDVFVVEILPRKDLGDPNTTFMLKALEIALGYRFMFLEEKSQFSPAYFIATQLEDMKAQTSKMVDRLNVLLIASEEYKLSDPENIIAVFGVSNLDNIKQNFKIWDQAKSSFYSAAALLMKSESVKDPDKDAFVEAVASFAEQTRKMNTTYTEALLQRLLALEKGSS
jgi:TIR domain